MVFSRACRVMLVAHLHVFLFYSCNAYHIWNLRLHFANLVKDPFFSFAIWKSVLPIAQLVMDSTSLGTMLHIYRLDSVLPVHFI